MDEINEQKENLRAPQPIPKEMLWIHNELQMINNAIDRIKKELETIKRPTKESNGTLFKVDHCKSLNVRSYGSANAPKVGVLYNDDIVRVYEMKDKWCRIDKEGKRWCYSDYLEPILIK